MNSDVRLAQPRKWTPHELENYDEVLSHGCSIELRRLAGASSGERLSFVCDTRAVHRRLYAALTPAEHPEYAGTYRGESGTSLEFRRIGVERESDGSNQEFAPPDAVGRYLALVADQANRVFSLPAMTGTDFVFFEIVKLFYIFGLVHPFLDGNGHIQRLIFAACVMQRSELNLKGTWTIHPRPYDIEIKLAFEEGSTDARLRSLDRILGAYVSR